MKNGSTEDGKLKAPDGTELFFRKDAPENPRAVFIFVHGLCEHLGRYDHLTGKFNDAGFAVYRFDNRGHGRSGGERGYVDNFIRFVDDADLPVEAARKEHPGVPLFMLGHSMGGFITAGYGATYGGKLSGQIFSGACTIALPIFESLKDLDFDRAPRMKIPNDLSSLICRDPAVVKTYEEDPLVLKETSVKLLGEVFLRGVEWLGRHIDDYRYPCLILHGGDDRIVTSGSSRYLYDHVRSSDREINIYDGLYHEILNEPEKEQVIADILAWVEARI